MITMLHLYQQGSRGAPGDVGPRGLQGGLVSTTPPLLTSDLEETVKRRPVILFPGRRRSEGPYRGAGDTRSTGSSTAQPRNIHSRPRLRTSPFHFCAFVRATADLLESEEHQELKETL